MKDAEINRVVAAVWRMESGRVIATLTRYTGDLGQAEDLAQDALLQALEQWPESGVPRSPGAWLTTVAKRRAIDAARRRERLSQKLQLLGRELETGPSDSRTADAADAATAAADGEIEDDLLRLVFTACHPVLSAETRVALTLRLVAGLRTVEIARAYLVPEPTVAQRITRAKRTLAKAKVPFQLPGEPERTERLSAVLEVIYLVFNEGYSATAGDHWMRPELCHEAVRLGRVLAGLMPAEPEVHGLVALMEIQSSRAAARTGPAGEPVRLLDQDRSRWDRLLIRRGLAALDRAEALGAGPGPYVLQAAIAACHARARTATETDWGRITALYDALAARMPSPVVELNRAVAVAMAEGPERGLKLVDELAEEPALRGYHLLPSVRGELLARLGQPGMARAEFQRAAALTKNAQERALLLERAADCAG